MLDKKSCAGRLDSPVRQDIEKAASMLGIDFILNVVLNDRKEMALDRHGEDARIIVMPYGGSTLAF